MTRAGITTARLDCLVLLEDATGKDHAWLLAHPEFSLAKGPTLSRLNEWVERRAMHEPLAYIRGKTEFYGREFLVTADTLQPRPETETIIDLLKDLVSTNDKLRGSVIADIGTGSGCIAITAKLELPQSEVIATDISAACLKIARKNALAHSAQIRFVHGDLLNPLLPLPDTIILANLPYVPDSHIVNEAALHEPKLAIFGGPDGLDIYRRLFRQIDSAELNPKYILAESMPFQHNLLAGIAAACNYAEDARNNFIQVFRSKI